jgi:hypothetical protein
VFLDGSNALDGGQPRFCRPQACYVIENFGGYLVATLWTTLTWHQAGKASPIEGCLCLIKGRPRNAKSGRRVENRHFFGAVPPEHLVTNLEKVPGIEEGVLFEQEIGHGFGVWIESAGVLEFQRLLVGFSTFGHQDRANSLCNSNYASSKPLSSENRERDDGGDRYHIQKCGIALDAYRLLAAHTADLILHLRRNKVYTF